MNKEMFESQWIQIKDFIRNRFGNLTDEDLRNINGRYENLISKLEERYGYTRTQAEGELHRFLVDRFPNYFATDKVSATPLRSDLDRDVRKEETSSALKWLALAGIPILLALGFLVHENSKMDKERLATQPKTTSEEMLAKEVKPADQALTLAIRDALAADQLTAPDLANIKINSVDGIITISGVVPSVRDRDEVLKVVQESSGVKEIHDLLEVRSS